MKRALIVVAAAGLLVGCIHEERRLPPGSNAQAKPEAVANNAAKPAMASEAAKPAASVKPPSAKEYYEVSKNRKTYVFGKLDSLTTFRSSGAAPVGAIEKAAYGPAGETVVFEGGDGIEAGLMADYTKNHPKK